MIMFVLQQFVDGKYYIEKGIHIIYVESVFELKFGGRVCINEVALHNGSRD